MTSQQYAAEIDALPQICKVAACLNMMVSAGVVLPNSPEFEKVANGLTDWIGNKALSAGNWAANAYNNVKQIGDPNFIDNQRQKAVGEGIKQITGGEGGIGSLLNGVGGSLVDGLGGAVKGFMNMQGWQQGLIAAALPLMVGGNGMVGALAIASAMLGPTAFEWLKNSDIGKSFFQATGTHPDNFDPAGDAGGTSGGSFGAEQAKPPVAPAAAPVSAPQAQPSQAGQQSAAVTSAQNQQEASPASPLPAQGYAPPPPAQETLHGAAPGLVPAPQTNAVPNPTPPAAGGVDIKNNAQAGAGSPPPAAGGPTGKPAAADLGMQTAQGASAPAAGAPSPAPGGNPTPAPPMPNLGNSGTKPEMPMSGGAGIAGPKGSTAPVNTTVNL